MRWLAVLLAVLAAAAILLRPWRSEAAPPAGVSPETVPADEPPATASAPLEEAPEETRRDAVPTETPERAEPTPPGTLRVRVVDEDGDGLSGAWVWLRATQEEVDAGRIDGFGASLVSEETDSEGRAELEIPAGTDRELRAGGQRSQSSLETVHVPALAPGEVRALTVTVLTRDDGVFRGRVVDAESGAPIPGIAVHVEHRSGRSFGGGAAPLPTRGEPAATTDLDGRFEVPHRSWARVVATFSGPGWSPQRAQLKLEGGPREAFVMRLRRSGRIEGLVIADDPAGLQVEAVTPGYHLVESSDAVMLSGEDVSFRTAADPSGSYTLEDLPSRVPLQLQVVEGREVLLQEAEWITLDPGESRRLDWQVGSGGVLEGRVVDEHGRPVAGQEVWLLPPSEARPGFLQASSQPTHRTRSDEQGNFALDSLRPGTWTVGLAPEETRSTPDPAGDHAPIAVPVEVPPGGAPAEVELVLYRGLHIEGVLLEPDGEPSSGWVLAHAEGRLCSGDAEEDGTFRVGPLVPGLYRLWGRASPRSGLAPSEPVEARAGQTGLELVLRRGAALSGRVVDANTGEEVSAEIALSGNDGSFQRTMRGMMGRESSEFEFQGLLPATYALTASTDDGRVGRLVGLAVPVGADLDELEIPVRPGATVVISYSGLEEYGQVRVRKDGVVLAGDGLARGARMRIAVPPGTLEVECAGETREVVLEVGQVEELHFEDSE